MLNYKVKVPASEYAKYYFLLRSFLIKSGLGGDTLKTSHPLDVEGAKRLQQMSAAYQSVVQPGAVSADVSTLSRSKSTGHIIAQRVPFAENKARLEHVVQM